VAPPHALPFKLSGSLVADLPDALKDAVFVIDDFYANPLAVRAFALGTLYTPRQEEANFAGRESAQSFPATDIQARFSAILGRGVEPSGPGHIYGRFRYALAQEQGATDVHVDDSDWTAVIYLGEAHGQRAGLVFYEHKATGLQSVPDSRELHALGFGSTAQFDANVICADTNTPDAWRILGEVEYQFNRCVIFRGNRLFHGIADTFGCSMSDARLTQNFFLREVAET